MAFTPRYTDPTEPALSTYWRAFSGECVWYTIGRIREVAQTPLSDPSNLAWPVTLNVIQYAKQIYPNADEANGWIKDGTTASLGAIACWTGNAGHCMNVEAINGSSITMSEYNFPTGTHHHKFNVQTFTLQEILDGISGLGAFQGFVRNPYVVPGPTPPGPDPPTPPTPTDDNIEVLIDCVINKKKRKMRLIIE